MRVDELIQRLSECPPGSEVRIDISIPGHAGFWSPVTEVTKGIVEYSGLPTGLQVDDVVGLIHGTAPDWLIPTS